MNIIQHWFIHKLFDQPQTIIMNTPQQESKPLSVTKCIEQDFYICYGYKNNYTHVEDYIFKMCTTEPIANNKEYAEISLDDILFVRFYKGDNETYISTNYRKWKKIKYNGKAYCINGRYIIINDELMKLYTEIEQNLT